MRIQNNIMAMNTHRFYTINNNAVSKSAEKLSSGYRVNRAGDDAAGLAISEKMRAEIRGLAMASKNAQDGVSMVQTAEGALTEVQNMLQRMKEIAVQAASDSNEDEIDRPALDQEFQQLISEIDDVAMTTTFNDMKLLDGSFQNKVIQIGSRTGNEMQISIGNMDAASLGLGGAGSAGAGVPTVEGLEMTDTAATKSKTQTADFGDIATGADDGVLSMTVNYTDASGNAQSVNVKLTIDGTNNKLVAADGTEYDITGVSDIKKAEVQDAFVAEFKKSKLADTFKVTEATDAIQFEAVEAGKTSEVNSILSDLNGADATISETLQTQQNDTAGADAFQTGAAPEHDVIFTVGGEKFAYAADQDAAVALGEDVNVVVAATIDATAVGNMANLIEQKTGYKPTANGTSLEFKTPEGSSGTAGAVNLLNQGNASKAIDICRDALNTVSTQRAELGAIQNRLEHKIANLDNTVENVSAAEARIRDVDIAKEMTNFTKNNILSQAATAMLAQANSLPQNVLSLLQ